MTIVHDTIAAEIAKLQAAGVQVAAPTTLGVGSDLYCDGDLSPDFGELDGVIDAVLIVGQALFRRLTTPRGALPDDPTYGRSVESLLNRGMTANNIRDEQGEMRHELLKDDRVDEETLAVGITQNTDTDDEVYVSGNLAESGEPFEVTMALTDAGLLLREIA